MSIQRFTKNITGRDFVVGDIHGCLLEFEREMHKVGFNCDDGDRVFSVGDLIDRGRDSHRCLELIDQPWFHAVRGNHEEFLVGTVLDPRTKNYHTQDTWLWYQNGGDWAEKYYNHEKGAWDEDFVALAEKVEDLPFSIEIVDDEGIPLVGICHAQPLSEWDHHEELGEYEQEYVQWGRELIGYEGHGVLCSGIERVYCGHTPVKSPLTKGNVTWIDTGAVFDFEGSKLTLQEILYE